MTDTQTPDLPADVDVNLPAEIPGVDLTPFGPRCRRLEVLSSFTDQSPLSLSWDVHGVFTSVDQARTIRDELAGDGPIDLRVVCSDSYDPDQPAALRFLSAGGPTVTVLMTLNSSNNNHAPTSVFCDVDRATLRDLTAKAVVHMDAHQAANA